MRCVELLETNELVFTSLRFRILVGQALLTAGNVQACIRVLDKDPRGEDAENILPSVGSLSEKSRPVLSPDQRINSNCTSHQTFTFQLGQRCLLLAKAHESMENKEGAIQFYKEALKANCENFEAFNRLISNFLITQAQKEELVKELSFSAENLWLKDYFLSRIYSEIRSSNEHEGMVRRRTFNDGQ